MAGMGEQKRRRPSDGYVAEVGVERFSEFGFSFDVDHGFRQARQSRIRRLFFL
jgi:hypothetical protein